MAVLVRRFSALTAVLAVAAVLVPAGNAGALGASVYPTLYVNYTMNCTFTITNDSGAKVSSIAPGFYQVEVITPQVFADVDLSGIYDMTACKSFVQFQLTGPGVNDTTTLQEGDIDEDNLQATFLPSSTYTAVDNNQPTVARATFTTTATGTPTAPAGPTSSSTGSSKSKGSTQSQLVGSAVVPFRGKLAANIDAVGKLALLSKGKPVGTLRAGLYTFTVVDNSAKSGFSIERFAHGVKPSAVSLTSVGYKGTHIATIDLKSGQWTFFSPGGKKNYFIVVS